jgi:hypothetical protein
VYPTNAPITTMATAIKASRRLFMEDPWNAPFGAIYFFGGGL